MAAIIYNESDLKPATLRGKTIAIIGYGSQGHAHAQNLRDSGHQVIVGLDAGRRTAKLARQDGFEVVEVAEATRRADYISILLPDETHGAVYAESIAPHLGSGKVLGLAHGFSIHFKTIAPPPSVDVVLVAPKGPGHLVRRVFTEGKGVPALVAVGQDASGEALDYSLAYAAGIGAMRAGVLATTFKEETETDLFGEQSVLCGGLTSLIKAGYETLVAAGYQPEVAYFECLHETKLIVDLMYEGGLAKMRDSISNTAEYGDLTQGPKLVGEATRQAMQEVLANIQSGKFAREWIEENRAGCPNFQKLRAAEKQHPIEAVGAKLRGMMSWIGGAKPAAKSAAAEVPAVPRKVAER